ncbi:MAG: hypothetical protein JO353_02315 [Phycisphaerae bacterium]|nr:hypothetical protein [Phycisphaerae bacterium]
MGADEKPNNRVALAQADGTVIVRNPGRPDILVWRKLLEFQTAVTWINFEKSISAA